MASVSKLDIWPSVIQLCDIANISKDLMIEAVVASIKKLSRKKERKKEL